MRLGRHGRVGKEGCNQSIVDSKPWAAVVWFSSSVSCPKREKLGWSPAWMRRKIGEFGARRPRMKLRFSGSVYLHVHTEEVNRLVFPSPGVARSLSLSPWAASSELWIWRPPDHHAEPLVQTVAKVPSGSTLGL